MTRLTRPILRSIVLFLLAALSTGCFAGAPRHLRLERSPVASRTTTTLVTASTPVPTVKHLSADLARPSVEASAVHATPPVVPATPETTPASCPPEGTRVLLIGDSLSHGLGPAVRPLADACGTTYFHHGVIGSHVTEWDQDAWLGQQLRRAKPTVVIMSMGGNDFQRFDPERVQPAIERVIARVEASGARFLWISPPTMPFEDRIDVRGMWAQTLENHPATATFPAHELSLPRVADRIHPTRSANHALAEQLWVWMANQDLG